MTPQESYALAEHPHCGHSHAGGASDGNARRLALVLGLVASFMLVEVVGGIWSGSLALLADAGHMLSDAGALTLALFALWVARRPPTRSHSFGYQRTEILAALAHGVLLVGIAINIVIEALRRVGTPRPIDGAVMSIVAAAGLLVNVASLAILHGGQRADLNVRGAWLHVLSDTLGSIGAIVAGLLVWTRGWHWADPVASALIACLVLLSAFGLLRDAVRVLMEAAPGHVDVGEVEAAMRTVPGVRSVHDLHVWTISSGLHSLSAHVALHPESAPQSVLTGLRAALRERFALRHVTLQLESPDFCDAEAVVCGVRSAPSGTSTPGDAR
ncbi:MAG TPA: cation diffusion facilitator family transporter [Gemmatimonadaceae bacterium]|nr:cation diffusion facilitator family transporter [Gemmatimonadaceae bacterium]